MTVDGQQFYERVKAGMEREAHRRNKARERRRVHARMNALANEVAAYVWYMAKPEVRDAILSRVPQLNDWHKASLRASVLDKAEE